MLEWGQLFSGEILWWGGNLPRGQLSRGAIFLGADCPGGNHPGCNNQRGQLSGMQFSSGAIVLEPPVGWNLSDGRNAHEHSTFMNPSNSAFESKYIIEVVLQKCLIHWAGTGYRLRNICLFKFHPTDSLLKIDGILVSL